MHRRKFLRLASFTSGAFSLAVPAMLHAESSISEPPGKIDDPLFQTFKEPSMQYRPMVRWWWNGDRIVGSELLRELDVLKAAGIGGVEINPIKFPNDAQAMDTRPLQWLSGEWIDILDVVLKGARERDMTCDMLVGSGWPFGGEFLTREEQSQMVALGTRDVTGPTRLEVTRTELLADVSPELVSPQAGALKELFSLALAPYELNTVDQVTNLSDRTGEERIVLEIPEGKHVLYYLVKLTGYMAVINGAPGANGPVLNHLDKAAVERYLTRLAHALTTKIGDLHPYVRAFFTDSIELEGANWCDDMAPAFQKRHGYDLLPWLPFILFKVGEMGNAIDGHYGAHFSPEFQKNVEAARYDFQTLRRELFNENFVATFATWCSKLGVKSRMQAYGTECDVMTASTMLDIPECETWIRSERIVPYDAADYRVGRNYTMINKFVSSAAHLSGKQLISCEEMTNTDDPFGVSLNKIKAAGDQSILAGVTQSVLHGYNYSPPEIPFPGWVRYGTYFSEHNTWWPYFHLWAEYRARISSVFQHSVMQADIAILPPTADLASHFGFQRDPFPQVVYPPYLYQLWEAIHQNGSGCDYITEDVIVRGEMNGGKLHYQQRSYKVLLLPEVEYLAPKTAEAITRFVAAGGTLFFLNRVPTKCAGMAEQHEADTIAAMMSEIQKKYPQRAVLLQVDAVSLLTWYRDLQHRFSVSPDVLLSEPKDFLSQVHYGQAQREIFFFVNYSGDQTHTFQAHFLMWRGHKAWRWDPQTGERQPLQWAPDAGTLKLTLGPVASMLIVLEHRSAKSNEEPASSSGSAFAGTSRVLRADWQVELAPVSGKPKTLSVSDWKEPALTAALDGFAGTITYSTKVQIEAARKCFIDLGVLHSVSELWVNGSSLGVRWFGNQTYDISHAVIEGQNELRLRLTTTLGNYVKTLKDNRTAIDWSKDTPIYPVSFMHDVLLRVL